MDGQDLNGNMLRSVDGPGTIQTGTGGNDIDAWIERLYNCKPLSETEVKSLCEKVKIFVYNVIILYIVLININI